MSKAIIKKQPLNAPQVAVAACSMALPESGSREIQLTPTGEFRSFDGRPVEAKFWRMTASLAQQLIAAAAARPTPYVIDYDHQTLHIEKNGQPAPAAGWFHKLEWREGVGLFGVDVEWTAKASGMIDAKEYRFISPVIGFATNGDVTGLYMAALTNNPAILGMDEVLTAAASMQFAPLNASITQESQTMSLLEKLIALLKLPAESTEDDVVAAIQKLIDTKAPDAAKPDPAKFVPVAALTALHGQVASLNAQLNTQSLESVIQNGLDSHRLLPSMVDWAREFGAKDTAALSAYISNLPVVAALNGTQSKDQPQAKAGELTESQVALCAAMGVSEKDYLATLAAEKRA